MEIEMSNDYYIKFRDTDNKLILVSRWSYVPEYMDKIRINDISYDIIARILEYSAQSEISFNIILKKVNDNG
jgi:hypothetical protein